MKKISQKGRSMVEMLGVLAIVGVLSVGAIAGYSKAMFKYKLNKQSQQISQIVSDVIKYKSVIIANAGSTTKHFETTLSYLKKLNVIPKEMIKTSTSAIYDALDTEIMIGNYGDHQNIAALVSFKINSSTRGKSSLDTCYNIFNIAKSFTDDLLSIGITGVDNEDVSNQSWYYGNMQRNCYELDKCIRTMDMNLIHELCNTCTQLQRCSIQYNVIN